MCSLEGPREFDGIAGELQWQGQDYTSVQLNDTFKSFAENRPRRGEKMAFKGRNLVPSQQCFHPLQVSFVLTKFLISCVQITLL